MLPLSGAMASAETLYRLAPGWAQTLLLNAYAWRIELHRYGAPYRQAVARLLEQERWEPERMRAYQDHRLRTLVRWVYDRSPYYRRVMDEARVRPSDIRGVRDIGRLPLLSREAVREHAGEMITERRPGRAWLHGHTSGTTGSPLGIWYDRETCVLNNAVDRRQKIWGGMGDADWIGLLLGRVVVPHTRTRPPFWRTNVVQRQIWYSSFHMNEENLDSYVQHIRRRRLGFLEGYPSTLFVLARHVLSRGTTLPMRAVFSSSETLHHVQRQTIEEAFECRLFDFYGLAERTIFAAECEEHNGKHLAEEFGFTEVVDEDGAPVSEGEPGYLVGTSLHNRAMPLIRYKVGDISALSGRRCACGRTSRLMNDVTTKAEDIVLTPDGRMVSPSVLTHPFKPLDEIVKSQIIQERLDHLLIKIVPADEFTAEKERALIASLQERLGSEVEIEVQLVDDIPREASGKYRWVISRIEHRCKVDWEDRKDAGGVATG